MQGRDLFSVTGSNYNPGSDELEQALNKTPAKFPNPIAESGEFEITASTPVKSFESPIGQFGTEDFTIAFWFNTTEKDRYFDLVGNRTDGSHGNFICIRMTGKHESAPEGRVGTEIDQDGNGRNYIPVDGVHKNLNDGKWHHVASVRKENSLRLYIDGKLSAVNYGDGIANIRNGNDFRLGRSYSGFIHARVKYHHVKIYNVALSEQEVAGLFEQDCVSLRSQTPQPQLPYQPVAKLEQEAQVGPDSPFISFGRKVGQFETRDFTISLWFNTADKTRDYDIAGNRLCGSHGSFVCIRLAGGDDTGQVHLEVDQDEDGTNYISVRSTKRRLNDGYWHHVAAVRKEGSLKLYIDGKLSAEGYGYGTADISNGTDFRLGKCYRHFANVKIRYNHFGLYEAALTDEEVSLLFERDYPSLKSQNDPVVECPEMTVDDYNEPYFSLGKNVGQFNTKDFTVSFWFETTATSRYFDLLGNRTAGSHGNFFCVRMTGQHESMPEGVIVAEVDQDESGTNYIAVTSKRKGLNDGKWHHVAVVRSGNVLELYVNGRLNAQDRSKEVTDICNENEFRLGRSYHDFEKIRISYSNFAVYNTALSDEVIETIYERRF